MPNIVKDGTPQIVRDGSIVLRPAGVYPIEIYSDARVSEFLDEDHLTPEEVKKLNDTGGRG
jgi:hypothetical protein